MRIGYFVTSVYAEPMHLDRHEETNPLITKGPTVTDLTSDLLALSNIICLIAIKLEVRDVID